MAKLDLSAVKALEWLKLAIKGDINTALFECNDALFCFTTEGTINKFASGTTAKKAASLITAASNASDIANTEVIAQILDEEMEAMPVEIIAADVEAATDSATAEAMTPYIEAMIPLYEYVDVQ